MTSLLETQRHFAAALRGASEALPRLGLRERSLAAVRRFEIYRNNILASCCNTLEATYPALHALVGADFFDFAARQYVRKHPSLSGDLNDYGDKFPRFLATLPQTAHLPYLRDVGELEWAMQEISRAAEPATFDARRLASIPPARYAELRFILHPASRLLSSPFPILAIWRMQHVASEEQGSINLNAGGVRLLVIRRHQEIELEPLSRGEYELLNALACGETFAVAAESALTIAPDFDVTVSLRDHIARRTITDFTY